VSSVADYDAIIHEAGLEWEVDPRLLKAVMLQESRGDPGAVSKAGARGLMQIMPDTGKGLGMTDLHDPVQSIWAGAKYLAEALDAEGSPEKALLRYHGGPGWRQKYGPESAAYVPGVQKHYAALAPKADAAGVTPARVQVAENKTNTATDAGGGSTMAKKDDVDPLSLLPPAPKAATAPAVKPAQEAPASALDLLPPAPKPAAPATAAPPAPQTADAAIAGTVSAEAAPALVTPEGAGRILDVGKQAWQSVTLPRVPSNLVMAPVYNPLIAGAETLLAGGNALFRGGQQTVQEVLNPLDPRLARDVAALPEVFPFGVRTFGGRPVAPRTPEAPPVPRLASEIPVTTAERVANAEVLAATPDYAPGVNPLSPEAATRSAAAAAERPVPAPLSKTGVEPLPLPEAGPQPGMGPRLTGPPILSAEDAAWVSGTKERIAEIQQANQAAGIPGNLGAAATPEQLAQLTPQQMKAYRRQAELGEALAPAPREVDRNIYVEGSYPTRAEYSADPNISQKEALHRERAPKEYDPRLEGNNAARVNKFEGLMGTDIAVDDLKVAKGKAAETDGAAYLAKARPLDLSPAVSWIDEQMANPRIRERSDVMAKLRKLRASLFDEGGNLKTDPSSGWGMHDELMADLEKAKDSTRAERYAKGQLIEYKRIIDEVNDTASDGAFRTFLDNQAGYAARINAMEILQKYRPKLTSGKTGFILPTAYHKWVADLAMRRGHPGVDAAMDIPDDVMRGLINIGKDLKRADNIDLGKARGSNTNLLFTLAQGTGIGMAHLGVAAATQGSGIGNLLLQGAINAGRSATGNVLLRRAARKGLAEPRGGYDYGPVQPPP